MKNANVFGLSLFGDGATIKRIPMINVMCAGVYNTAAVLDVVDTTGKKKDAFYQANLFLEHVDALEKEFIQTYPGNEGAVNLTIFDGAKSIQNAGLLMSQKYHKITTLHGGEHVLALFFKDIFDLPELRPLVYVHKKLYRFFGGSKHKPHAIWRKESSRQNNGVSINILRVTDTRMGGLAIAWLRNFRLRPVFNSIMYSHEYTTDKDFNVSFIPIMSYYLLITITHICNSHQNASNHS